MRRPLLIALAIAALSFALLVARFSFVCDDAFIAFRYSRNFAEGLGLRFNVGVDPPVEGYTQFGWIVWVGLLEWLKLDPTVWARATTIVAGALLLGVVTRFAHERLRFGPLATAATALTFATQPTVAVWSTGGLGTMVSALLLFATFERLLGDPDRPHVGQAALFGVTAALMRADGVYWLGLTLAFAFLWGLGTKRVRLRRAALVVGGSIAAAVLIQLLWRISYYDDYLPNTVRAKVGMSTQSLGRGVRYVSVYLLSVPALALVAGAGTWSALRAQKALLAASGLLTAATFVYCILVGGDFMTWGRFVLPATPHLALLLGYLVQRQVDRGRAPAGALMAAACVLLSVLAAYDVFVVPAAVRARFHFRWNVDEYVSETQQWRRMNARVKKWALTGKALKLYTEPDDTLVADAVGAVGYYSDMFIYDRFGLTHREAARVPPEPGARRSPGHDRKVPVRWFAKYAPTYSAATIRRRSPEDPEGRGFSHGQLIVPLPAEGGFPRSWVLVLTPFPKRAGGGHRSKRR